jgi:hypothetical protein
MGCHYIRAWKYVNVPLFLLSLFLLQGCTSRYTVPSEGYREYEGEVNRHSRLIGASPEQIFWILTDRETFRSLCPKGTVVTYETPPPYRVGTLIRINIMDRFRLEWHLRVEKVVPGRMIRTRFLDGFFAGGTELWELEAEGAGTRVVHTIIVQPKGFLRKAAWVLKVRKKHDERVEEFLDSLERSVVSPRAER